MDRGGELSTSQILKLIDEMAEAGTKKLQLTGGEPFLRKDIGEIVHHAKRKGLFTGISASGIFIPERVSEIKDVDIVFISLDGEREVHDAIRGKGSYDKVMEAIEALRENNIKFWITTVINRKNMNSIDYVLDIAKSMKSYANFVILYYVDDYDKDHLTPQPVIKELALNNEENREIIQYLIRKKRSGEPIGSSYGYLEYLLKWKDLNNIYRNDIINGVKCWAGKLYCHIGPEGMLYPCGTAYWRVNTYDSTKLGFRKAFELSNKTPCNSCILACELEHNLVFSLNIKTILGWLKTLWLQN